MKEMTLNEKDMAHKKEQHNTSIMLSPIKQNSPTKCQNRKLSKISTGSVSQIVSIQGLEDLDFEQSSESDEKYSEFDGSVSEEDDHIVNLR